MRYLNTILREIYDSFPAEDQDFIKAYWDVMYNSFLDYFQKDIEKDIDNSLFYMMPQYKRFWKSIKVDYDIETFSVDSVPYKVPTGTKELTAYGEKRVITTNVDLPVDLGDDVIINLVSGDYTTIDGGKVLGSGNVDITYETSLIDDPDIVDGYITNSSVTLIRAERTPYPPLEWTGWGTVTAGGNLRDENADFSNLKVNTEFQIGATTFYLDEAVDEHTVSFTVALPLAGEKVYYSHKGYEFVDTILFDYIPSFESGLFYKTDYWIKNGRIGFVEQSNDVEIAERVYLDNPEIRNKFGKFIGLKQGELSIEKYHSQVQALWKSRYDYTHNESMSFMLHAFLGLPWVSPAMDDITITGTNTIIGDENNTETFLVKRNNHIYCSTDYFEFNNQVIHKDTGGYLKIVEYIDQNNVVVDGVLPAVGETFDGRCSLNKVSSIAGENKYGEVFSFSIPFGSIPFYEVGDVVTPWNRICSGVRVYDAQDRNTDINTSVWDSEYDINNSDDFLEEGYSDTPDARDTNVKKRSKALRASVFIVEFDMENVVDMNMFKSNMVPPQNAINEVNTDRMVSIKDEVTTW